MCSPSCMDRLFINLKVLSQLLPGQKIYTSEDYLILDTGVSYKQVLTRWWLNETRERTLKKIQEVIRSAVYCGQNAINSELVKESSEKSATTRQWEIARERQLQIDNITLLQLLSTELSNSLGGLQNLKDTYKDDATLRAKLDLEIELIERHIQIFQRESQKGDSQRTDSQKNSQGISQGNSKK